MRRAGSCLGLLLAFAGPALAAPSIDIVSPQNEETVHENSGRVPVRVELGEELRSGETLAVYLDGKRYGRPEHSDSFTLEGIERGEHRLRAVLLDASGREVAASPPVTFTLWQASALFPNRKKK